MKTPCSPVHFFIDVTVAGILPTQALVDALQSAYDAGAEGMFEVSQRADLTVVRFERTVADQDSDYLRDLVSALGVSVPNAAQLQLAAELEELSAGVAGPLVCQLSSLSGVIVDPHKALDLVFSLEEM